MFENKCAVSSGYGNLSPHTDRDLIVYYCGAEQCQPGHYWSGIRDHYLIHYIISGKGMFIMDNTTYHLEAGQGFLICANTLCYYRANVEDPWEYCWVGFQGRNAKEYLAQLTLNLKQPIFNCPQEYSLEQIISKMLEVENNTTGRDFVLTGLLYSLFSILAKSGEDLQTIHQNPNPRELYVKKAMTFIEQNYSRKITIEEISNYVGIHRKYLSSLFNEFLHTPPQSFLLNYRMDKACILLTDPLLSIRDIAHSVGYEDALLFSKMFKKSKGMPPTQYRNRFMGRL